MSETGRTYEIQDVAALTGLTPERIRAWERRYAVIRPERQPNGYRAYTGAQVALLRAYAKLVSRGARIGELVERDPAAVVADANSSAPDGTPLGALMAAIEALDRDTLESLVAQQLALRGLRRFADEIVMPLGEVIGDLWVMGKLPISAEHLASEVILHALKGGLRHGRSAGPLVLCAGLPGERHEWGFLCTLARVHDRGWQVHYLGGNMPIREVIAAAWQLKPQAVALSVSDPDIFAFSRDDLLAFPESLPDGVTPVIGGRGIMGQADLLADAGFRLDFDTFGADRPVASLAH